MSARRQTYGVCDDILSENELGRQLARLVSALNYRDVSDLSFELSDFAATAVDVISVRGTVGKVLHYLRRLVFSRVLCEKTVNYLTYSVKR